MFSSLFIGPLISYSPIYNSSFVWGTVSKALEKLRMEILVCSPTSHAFMQSFSVTYNNVFHMNSHIQSHGLTIKNCLSICFIMCLYIMFKGFSWNWCECNWSLVFSSMFIALLFWIRKICLRLASFVVGCHCLQIFERSLSVLVKFGLRNFLGSCLGFHPSKTILIGWPLNRFFSVHFRL